MSCPAGATSLDFAYRIHTDVGHKCVGAKVNDRLVPLNYQLQNGEVVKIIQTKNPKGPSRITRPEPGLHQDRRGQGESPPVVPARSATKIFHTAGNCWKPNLNGWAWTISSMKTVASHFPKYEKLEDFLAAIGYGGVSMGQVTGRLIDATRHAEQTLPEFMQPTSASVRPGHRSRTGGPRRPHRHGCRRNVDDYRQLLPPP